MTKKEFLEIFLKEKNRWYRYAVWMISDQLEAEDAVQELYLKLWAMKDQLSRYKNQQALAYRMLKNLCIDRLRKMKSTKKYINDYAKAPTEDFMSRQVELIESEKIMEHIISQLPETQRLVLQLKNVEGYSISQIADELEMNTNAVTVNLSRARTRIREQYFKWMHYEAK